MAQLLPTLRVQNAEYPPKCGHASTSRLPGAAGGHTVDGMPLPLLIKSGSGYLPVTVMVEIPAEQFSEIIAKFPNPHPFRGQDPRVNEAIRDGITDEEKKQVGALLRIWHTNFTFVFDTIPRPPVDQAKPDLEINGKKFWIQGNGR
jgi:hypothetical protein